MKLEETTAVVLAVIYLVLAIREIRWCWVAGFASSLLYLDLFFRASLYMESALQVFYMAMAVYGWWCWRPREAPAHGADGTGPTRPDIERRPPAWHACVFIGVLLLAGLNGWILRQTTDAAWPYVDAFISWGSIVTTWMVARKLLENWGYWLVLDGLALVLALERGLHLTAALFALYLVLAAIGWRSWLLRWRESCAPS